MTSDEAQKIQDRLAKVVFSLSWPDENGELTYGTGFFIGADGIALTAYHNLSREMKDCPDGTQTGRFGGVDVAFRWVLRDGAARAWQEEHDIAILQADQAPAGIEPTKVFFLPSRITRARGSIWAEHGIAMLGYPRLAGFERIPITGHVNRELPLRDHRVQRTDGGSTRVSGAIQIMSDSDREFIDLRGMSGSPVYDLAYGGIIGLLVGVEKRAAAASELWPVAECWPAGKKILRKLPVPPPFPAISRWLLLFPLVIIALWWYWQPIPIPKHLTVDVLREGSNHREKLEEGSKFIEGERVRFLITSPVAGHLYVVDQQLNLKGEPGPPELIFPTKLTGVGRNRVSAGAQTPFPAPDEEPPYLDPEPEGGIQDYGGELLTVLVYANPLNIELQPNPITVSPDQIPLDGMKPRTFVHPSQNSVNALAVQRIRVAVHGAEH